MKDNSHALSKHDNDVCDIAQKVIPKPKGAHTIIHFRAQLNVFQFFQLLSPERTTKILTQINFRSEKYDAANTLDF